MQTVRVLNNVSWKPIAEFEHPSRVTDDMTVIFQEVVDTPGGGVGPPENDENSGPEPPRRRYQVCEAPFEVRTWHLMRTRHSVSVPGSCCPRLRRLPVPTCETSSQVQHSPARTT